MRGRAGLLTLLPGEMQLREEVIALKSAVTPVALVEMDIPGPLLSIT